jgi:type VI secretion system protein ImpF
VKPNVAFQLDVLVTLSVLDRLIDLDPRSQTEAPLSRAESLRRMRAAVRRDLEWLLNSRRIATPPPVELAELNRSLYVYGLPDLSSVHLANPNEQHRLLQSIERLIETFEPRLKQVRVIRIEGEGSGNFQRLNFRIEGLLQMDPAPEPVSFDTMLDGVNQQYSIKPDRAA